MRVHLVFALAIAGCSSSTSESPPIDAASDSTTLADAGGDVDETRIDMGVDTATCTLVKPYSTKDTACNACAQSKCCAEVNACLGDKRCDDDYVNCILACALLPDDAGGDASAAMTACLADCAAKSPEGKAEYDAAIGCVDTACKGICK